MDKDNILQRAIYNSIVNDRPLPTEIMEKINNLTNYLNKAKDMKTESNETTVHTQGPWEWYWRFENGEANCGVLHRTSNIAYSICRAPRYATQAEWTANARLIAAAPDMLEALIKTYHGLQKYVTERRLAGDHRVALVTDRMRAELRNTIAKAEGREPQDVQEEAEAKAQN